MYKFFLIVSLLILLVAIFGLYISYLSFMKYTQVAQYVALGDIYYQFSKLSKALEKYQLANEIQYTETVQKKIKPCELQMDQEKRFFNQVDSLVFNKNYQEARKKIQPKSRQSLFAWDKFTQIQHVEKKSLLDSLQIDLQDNLALKQSPEKLRMLSILDPQNKYVWQMYSDYYHHKVSNYIHKDLTNKKKTSDFVKVIQPNPVTSTENLGIDAKETPKVEITYELINKVIDDTPYDTKLTLYIVTNASQKKDLREILDRLFLSHVYSVGYKYSINPTTIVIFSYADKAAFYQNINNWNAQLYWNKATNVNKPNYDFR